MYEAYGRQTERISAAVENLTAERAALEKNPHTENPTLTAYRKSENFSELTRDLLIELVDHILVFENGSIRIKLRHGDEIRRTEEFIEKSCRSEASEPTPANEKKQWFSE